MRRLLISTLGFEEAFLIRFLLRNQPTPEDFILIVSPLPSDDRLLRAFGELEKFVERYIKGIKLERLEIPVVKFHNAIVIIAKKILSSNINNAIVNLSGGMRTLILAVLAAVKITLGDRAEIEIELEDRRDIVRFKPSIMDLKVPSLRQIAIINAMKELGRECTLSKISSKVGTPRSSVYKEIKKMIEEGFVIRTEDGHFALSELGISWSQY